MSAFIVCLSSASAASDGASEGAGLLGAEPSTEEEAAAWAGGADEADAACTTRSDRRRSRDCGQRRKLHLGFALKVSDTFGGMKCDMKVDIL